MKKRAVFYIALALGIVIGNFLALGSWLLRPKDAQAQCVRMFLSSCSGYSGNCSCSGTHLDTEQTDMVSPGYRVALCYST